MEVVFKEGMIYLKGNKFGKKTWRKTWMVLYPTSIFGIGRVELFDLLDGGLTTPTSNASKPKFTQGRRVVQLCDCLSVIPAPEESCPPALPNDDCRAFYLNTTQRSYILASESYHDWMGALCQLAFQKDPGNTESREKERGDGMEIAMEDNELYATWKTARYQVTVQTNEASRRCQLTGSYLLLPEQDTILLQDLQTGQTVYCWPYHLLRRFGQVKGGFSFEAGRRCTSGEGQFTFLSKHAPQIYKAIVDALTLHSEMDYKDTKTSTQPPGNSSSHQLPRSSSSPKLPHSSSPPSPHTSSSSPKLHHTSSSSSSPHPPNKQRVPTRTLTDLSDRPTAPPLPMRNNLLPNTPIITPVTERVPGPEPMADSDSDLYATIEDHRPPAPLRAQHSLPAPLRAQHSPPAPLRAQHSLPLYEEEEEERCHSLDTVDLNKLGLAEGSPHYNLRRGVIGRAGEREWEKERMGGSSACVYALVSKPSQTQPLSLAWPMPQPQTQSRSMPNLAHLQLQAQLQGEEETASGGSTGVPVSFKQKLSDILGKDLAKFQQPQPSLNAQPPLPPLATVTPRGSEY